jgi:hypothetical protein
MLRAETPQEQFNLIGAGRRNLIINGDMKVAQRGTSFSLTDDDYTLDRWQFAVFGSSGHGTYTVSQDTSDYPVGYRKSMKIDCTTADTSIATDAAIVLRQRLEGQDLQHLGFATSEARPLMLSFWIKSNLTGIGVVNLYNVNANKHIGATYSINSADTWEYKTVLIQGDTANTFSDDNQNRLEVRFYFAAGSNFSSGTQVNTWSSRTPQNDAADLTMDIGSSTSNYVNITGVQLELGKVATPFEHRSFGEELALCQRYFQKSTEYSVYPANGPDTSNFASSMGSTLNLVGLAIWSSPEPIQLPVEMRAYPTMTRYGNSQGYWGYLHLGTAGPSGLSTINFHSNVYIGGTPKTVYVNNQVSTNPMWGVKGMWTADAEL